MVRYLIALLLFCGFVANAQTGVYTDKVLKVTYPTTWDTLHLNGKFFVRTKPDSTEDAFLENINFSIKPLGTKTLQEYTDWNIENLRDNIGKTLAIAVSDYTVGVNKLPAKLLEYETVSPANDTNIRFWQLLLKTQYNSIIITYTSVPSTYERYLPEVKQMVDLVEFK